MKPTTPSPAPRVASFSARTAVRAAARALARAGTAAAAATFALGTAAGGSAHTATLLALAGAAPVLATSAGDARAAGTLYRWREADGSLTFSPTPPTDDRSYETVDATTLRPVGESRATGITRTPPALRTPAPPRATVPVPGPTPVLGAAAMPSPDAPSAERSDDASEAAARGRRAIVPSLAKPDRCDELRKRVVSLERRLSTRLSPTDMDNTVIHMARYQQSVDRHCR